MTDAVTCDIVAKLSAVEYEIKGKPHYSYQPIYISRKSVRTLLPSLLDVCHYYSANIVRFLTYLFRTEEKKEKI